MKKNTVKLNENMLRKIVAESVKKVLKESKEDFDYSSSMRKIKDSINLLADAVGSLYQSGNKYCEPFQKIKVELIELANQFEDEYDKPYENPIHPDSYLNGDFAF